MPKRLAITGPYTVEVMEYEDGRIPDGHVLVRTELASGKHGTTTAMFDGATMRGQRFDQEMRMFVPEDEEPPDPDAPRQPGNSGTSGVGTVEAVGDGVTKWRIGDRVLGHMDIRETNVCGEDRLWELGEIAPETALLIEPAYVSIHCIRESNLRYGDTVAVIGLGALGLIAVEMARASGASKVFAVDTLAKRREWALANGADQAFDPAACDVGLEVHKATGGKGVDVAIELAGVYAALNEATRCARICGTVCSAGFYQGEAKDLWLGREWHHNRLTIVVPHGCGWGHPPRSSEVWDEKRASDTIVDLMRKGVLRCHGLIDPIVSIDEGQRVFDLMRDDPHELLKYAVRF